MNDLYEQMKEAITHAKHNQGNDVSDYAMAAAGVAQSKLDDLLALYKKRGEDLNRAADVELELRDQLANEKLVTQSYNHTVKVLRSRSEITKREHFAAMAMQGFCYNRNGMLPDAASVDGIALHAVKVADALLAALEVKP